jgi:hypothetical protein
LFGEEFGPVSKDVLQQLVQDGTLSTTDEVRGEATGWLPVAQVLAGAQAAVTATGSAPAEDAAWYCRIAGMELGPLPLDDLVRFAENGELTAEDDVRYGTEGKWRKAASLGRLASVMDLSKIRELRPSAPPVAGSAGSPRAGSPSAPVSTRPATTPAGVGTIAAHPATLSSPGTIPSVAPPRVPLATTVLDNRSAPTGAATVAAPAVSATASPPPTSHVATAGRPSAAVATSTVPSPMATSPTVDSPASAAAAGRPSGGGSDSAVASHPLRATDIPPVESVDRTPPTRSTESAPSAAATSRPSAAPASLRTQPAWQPPRPVPRSTSRSSSDWGALLQPLLQPKALGAVAVILLAVVAVFGGSMLPRSTAGDRKKLETLQNLHKEFRSLREKQASEGEWSSFAERANKEVAAISAELSKTASRREPWKQQLLWAAKYRWKEMMANGRTKPSAAEQDFERNLYEAARQLGMEQGPPPSAAQSANSANSSPEERADD